MEAKLIASIALELQPQLLWASFSTITQAFLVGDAYSAFSLRPSPSATPVSVTAPPASESCNLPLSTELLNELLASSRNGLQFLSPEEFARAAEIGCGGDLLRTLVFGPDYGTCMLHSSSGAVLGLRSSSINLLKRGSGTIELLGKTATRGRAALSFAAHPTEPVIIYGDNYGTFHSQRFDLQKGKFSKASKIAEKTRKASWIEFVDSSTLIIGGMGYLSSLRYDFETVSPLHEISIAVRDFVLLDDKRVLVNQGLHGISSWTYNGANGFAPLDFRIPSPPGDAVRQIVSSTCGRYLMLTAQSSSTVRLYSLN